MSSLILGWEVTQTLEPRYWVQESHVLGDHIKDDLVYVKPDLLDTHTAIIAQSGSGKSFFLGRLIEEILLNTKARCVIIDPNSDFRNIYEVADNDLWQKPTYNNIDRKGKLPHESSKDIFEDAWSDLTISVKIGEPVPNTVDTPENSKHLIEQLKIPLTSLNVSFFSDEIDPFLKSEIYHCHEFIRTLEKLLRLRFYNARKEKDLIEEAKMLFDFGRQHPKSDFRKQIESIYFSDQQITSGIQRILLESFPFMTTIFKDVDPSQLMKYRISSWIDKLVTTFGYISKEAEHYYLAKAHEFLSTGVLLTKIQKDNKFGKNFSRLEVIDLPSFKNKYIRQIVINAFLESEWNKARSDWTIAMVNTPEKDKRVPTFLIIDEAHNLIPSKPVGKSEYALREQFRRIVAEGRKFGLFLILVSQRPDKLDQLVLSECENVALMKITNDAILDLSKKMFGLSDISDKMLNKCLEFEVSRALIAGRWVPDGPKILYSAARRTVEGGRNLNSEYWATAIVKRKTKKPKKQSSESKKKGSPKAKTRTTIAKKAGSQRKTK